MTDEPQNVSNFDDIPLELWAKILSYLPVKSVLRCKSVSKSWRSIISHPKFSSIHVKHFTNNPNNTNTHHNPPHLVFWKSCGWVLHCSSVTFDNGPRIKFPAPQGERNQKWDVCNALDGLILLHATSRSHNNNNTIVLWNPSINRAVYLPPPPPDLTLGLSPQPKAFVKMCLLHDAPNDDDYKVVIFHPSLLRSGVLDKLLVDVFSLKTLSWRRSVDGNINTNSSNSSTSSSSLSPPAAWLCSLNSSSASGCACVRGSAHWIGGQLIQEYPKLVSFDVTSNKFTFTKLPPVEDIGKVHKLVVLSGSNLGLIEEHPSLDHFTIWALERCSSSSGRIKCPQRQQLVWTKKYELDVHFSAVQAFCLSLQKRDTLFSTSVFGGLCDLETGEWKRLSLKNEYGHVYNVVPYVESLLLLGAASDQLKTCSIIR